MTNPIIFLKKLERSNTIFRCLRKAKPQALTARPLLNRATAYGILTVSVKRRVLRAGLMPTALMVQASLIISVSV